MSKQISDELAKLAWNSKLDRQELKRFINRGFDVNTRINDLERTALMSCSRDCQAVEYLLSVGALPDLQDYYGMSALHFLTIPENCNSLKCARMLIDTGANLNIQKKDGSTPLICLCISCQTKNGLPDLVVNMCQLLLDSGADANLQDGEGRTALMHLCLMHGVAYGDYSDTKSSNPLIDIGNLLIKFGGNPNVQDKDGNTALLLLFSEDSIENRGGNPKILFEMLDVLLSNGAELNMMNKAGESAIGIVSKADVDTAYGRNLVKAILKRLVNAGAVPDAETRKILKLDVFSPNAKEYAKGSQPISTNYEDSNIRTEIENKNSIFTVMKRMFLPPEMKIAMDILDEADFYFKPLGNAFSHVRHPIEAGIKKQPRALAKLIRDSGKHPRIWVYSMICNISGDYAESGQYHIYRGVLKPFGEKFLEIHDEAMDELIKLKEITGEVAAEQKSKLREGIASVG